jgi:TolB-like protein/DNA-binding winged helix-turn-helix (wHTH) protein/Tfp pilus assembly protein PilF
MESSAELRRTIRLGEFDLDLRAGELRSDDYHVILPEKPFQILTALLERPGEMVTRDDLVRRLWPAGTFVDFNLSLNKAVNRLREALRDSAERPRYIETVPKRGYRLVVEVSGATVAPPTAVAALSEPPSQKKVTVKRWTAFLIAGLGLVAAVALVFNYAVVTRPGGTAPPPIRAIAVLPLENVSGDPDQDYFADSITDELITELGKIGELRVVSRTSVMRYKDMHKSLAQIAHELKVDAVIEGTVLRSSNRVRITAQLIEASTDKHLWAESYEGEAGDVLALQDEVATAIANHIRIKLSPEQRVTLSSSQVVNPGAHDAYLRGRYLWEERTPEALRKAIEYFNDAIRKDPQYAQAYAGLANTYNVLSNHDISSPRDSYPKAKAAALKALEIDETLAEAHVALGRVEWGYDWDTANAEKEFLRAIQLNPSNSTAHQWYAGLLAERGRIDEALREAKSAFELDPLSVAIPLKLADTYYFSHQYDEAIEQARNTVTLHPSSPDSHQNLAVYYLAKKMYAPFLTEAQLWLRSSGEEFSTEAAAGIGRIDAAHYTEALRILINQAVAERKVAYSSPVWIAYLCAERGDRAQAYYWLETAYTERDDAIRTINADPGFDTLRSDQRFRDLLRRIGLTL